MPTTEDQYVTLAGEKFFSELDYCKSTNKFFWIKALGSMLQYPQGPLSASRLPFRVTSAPEKSQQIMAKILSGMPRVVVHLDDILIIGQGASHI